MFLRTAAGVAAAAALPHFAFALDYPTRPVRLIVGFDAGGSPDVVARLLGQWLSERLGQTFVIENRPGAGTNIATEAVVRATPDGYTLLLPASARLRSSWWSTRHFRLTPSPNLSPMPKPIRARST
jgi:tripartite-type tricarboxylate transporter receptor subunit TctC